MISTNSWSSGIWLTVSSNANFCLWEWHQINRQNGFSFIWNDFNPFVSPILDAAPSVHLEIILKGSKLY